MNLGIVSNFEIGISDLNHNLFRVSIFEIRISFFAVPSALLRAGLARKTLLNSNANGLEPGNHRPTPTAA